jgi:hypothetical protein
MNRLTLILFCVTILQGCVVLDNAIASMESICDSCNSINSKSSIRNESK